jgi:hypothetical protein
MMISPAIARVAVQGLRDARAELIQIPKSELSRSKLTEWSRNWSAKFLMAEGSGGGLIRGNIRQYMQGHNHSDIDVFDEVRSRIVDLLDRNIRGIDEQETVVPILDELILRVADTKLSTLLREFNAIKDSQPNVAAIAFRTIACLVIQERAKRVAPQSQLAQKDDLALEPSLSAAIDKCLFPSGEERLLKRFRDGGQKDMFDIVAHKPGSNALVEKAYLSDAVELLNKLLPNIV